jgi:hypothetical protein
MTMTEQVLDEVEPHLAQANKSNVHKNQWLVGLKLGNFPERVTSPSFFLTQRYGLQPKTSGRVRQAWQF